MKIFSKFNSEYTIFFIIILFFVCARIINLSIIGEKIFDEVYFPVMAHDFLVSGNFYDVHPPTGKLIIAVSEYIFGNKSFSWRFFQAISGILFLGIIFLFVKEFFKNKIMAIIATTLFAIDGLFIVYSRVGLIDIFMVLFGFCSLYFIAKFKNYPKKYIYLWLTGLFIGLTISVKWIGLGFYFIILSLIIFQIIQKKLNLKLILTLIGSLILLPLLVYVASFIPLYKLNIIPEIIKWHSQVWHYHLDLTDGHTYSSKWWSWPLLVRPIWFYFNEKHDIVRGIIAMSNPILLWSSTIGILVAFFSLIYKFFMIFKKSARYNDQNLWFLFSGWLIFYLPWIFISRVVFFYHYMMAYSFALILLAYWINLIYKKYELVAYFIILIFVIVGLIYLPLWIAWPIPEHYYKSLMIFKSWI